MESKKNINTYSIPAVNIKDYDYYLPEDRIAKYPLPERDKSKLLLYRNGEISESLFENIVTYLPQDSFLVFNDSKVIHARLLFRKPTGANIEIFCLEPVCPQDFSQNFSAFKQVEWKCLIGNAGKWKTGKLRKQILIENKIINFFAEKINRIDNNFIIKFSWDFDISFGEIINLLGEIPIPPYLKRNSEELDSIRYQTIYARSSGSVAAPTAGLHFTKKVLANLNSKNIKQEFVTLHVTAGTFKPVQASQIIEHRMHREWIEISVQLLYALKKHKTIISVGTTSLRTLESIYWFGLIWILTTKQPEVVPQWVPYMNNDLPETSQIIDFLILKLESQKQRKISFFTELIIIPGYNFRIINGLITNFHQPKSTLLLLVAALVGNQKWKAIYRFAIENGFRFLSYGDSSLLLPQI